MRGSQSPQYVSVNLKFHAVYPFIIKEILRLYFIDGVLVSLQYYLQL